MDRRLVNLIGALGVALADGQQHEVAAASGLPGSDAAALNAVGQAPGSSIESVRTKLAISHPGAVRAVDRLVGRGLVERGEGVDGRTRGLRLTAPGTAVWQRLNEARLQWLHHAISRLDASQLAQMTPAIETLLTTLTTGYEQSEHLCRLCDERVCPQRRCPVTLALGEASCTRPGQTTAGPGSHR